MLKTIEKEWQAKIAIIFFVLYVIWWIGLRFIPYDSRNMIFHYFAGSYGLIALWGGIWGLITTLKWGSIRSIIGRAITMFALGLFAQEFGQLAYAYYILVLHIEVPYPSIGDVGYFGSVIFKRRYSGKTIFRFFSDFYWKHIDFIQKRKKSI